MKCIRYSGIDGSIKRVEDSQAERLVKKGDATFVSKKTWKEKVRDIGKAKPEAVK